MQAFQNFIFKPDICKYLAMIRERIWDLLFLPSANQLSDMLTSLMYYCTGHPLLLWYVLLLAATCNVKLQQIVMDIILYLSNLTIVDLFMHIVCVVVFLN